jgi:hypothetical protein
MGTPGYNPLTYEFLSASWQNGRLQKPTVADANAQPWGHRRLGIDREITACERPQDSVHSGRSPGPWRTNSALSR